MLNSDTLTQLVRPLQARGEHNPAISTSTSPAADPPVQQDSPEHRQLVDLAERAEQVAQAVELYSGVAFQALRRRIRAALADNGVGQARIIYSLSRDNMLPFFRMLRTVHPQTRTPMVALLVSSGLTIAFVLWGYYGAHSFLILVVASAAFPFVIYFFTLIAYWSRRNTFQEEPGSLRSVGGARRW